MARPRIKMPGIGPALPAIPKKRILMREKGRDRKGEK